MNILWWLICQTHFLIIFISYSIFIICIYIAGDSRCIIVQRGGKMRPMSVDHKPNREDEERRIVQLGGKVIHWGRWRVQGVLAVSRWVYLYMYVCVYHVFMCLYMYVIISVYVYLCVYYILSWYYLFIMRQWRSQPFTDLFWSALMNQTCTTIWVYHS